MSSPFTIITPNVWGWGAGGNGLDPPGGAWNGTFRRGAEGMPVYKSIKS